MLFRTRVIPSELVVGNGHQTRKVAPERHSNQNDGIQLSAGACRQDLPVEVDGLAPISARNPLLSNFSKE